MLDYFQNLIANCASEWRPVVGYEGVYEVSRDGRVRSLDRVGMGAYPGKTRQRKGAIMKAVINPTGGHPTVSLSSMGKSATISVHRIMWIAWMGPYKKPLCLDHKNGDPKDNRLENLRLVTQLQNIRNRLDTDNKLGHRGIQYHTSSRKKQWSAIIHVGGQRLTFGPFVSREEAIEARLAAEREHWGNDAPAVVRS